MKANVFSENLPDGTVRVYHPESGVSGQGDSQREACDRFVQALHEWCWSQGYSLNPTLVWADE